MRTAPSKHESRAVGRMALTGAAMWLIAAAPALAADGYSYFRTVEGYADLETAVDGEILEVAENHPIVAGDLLRVASGGRVEAVLSDGALLRVDDRTELLFASLAWTPDSQDTSTRLELLTGEIQLVLPSDLAGLSPVEIETGNATFYLDAPGEYRLRSDGYGVTEVVVRDGLAEVQTDRGSAIVRSGESGWVDGDEWATVEVAAAGRRDRLEQWGDELDAEARLAQVPYVEPELRYRAARMANYGVWIDVGGRSAWRPHVGAGWRPYVSGSWVYTPSGLTWVSSEPWGWIPSHYGSWDLVPGYGWVWFAGGHYSPAWVYWYWGPTHVAWVPSGYYTSFYVGRHHGYGPRFGVYGWAGGRWDHFGEWVFCPVRYFGRPHYNRYFRAGREVARHATYRDLPRGVIATDTRSIRREVWGQPDKIQERLTSSRTRLARGELPDVTDFVARKRDIAPELAEIVRPREIARSPRTRATAVESKAAAARSGAERTKSLGGRLEERARRGSTRERGDREVVTRSRSRFDVRREGELRTFERGVEGRSLRPSDRADLDRPQADATVLGRSRVERADPSGDRREWERSVFERRSVERGDGRELGRRPIRAAPRVEGPRVEDRPIVRDVIDRARGRERPDLQRGEPSRRQPEARPAPAPRRPPTASRGDDGRGRGSRAESSRGSSRRSSASRSSGGRARSDSRRPATRRKAGRKPPG